MATASKAPTGKKIGNTTIGATAGATAGSQVGFAVADVVVELAAGIGWNLTAVENSLGVIISAGLAILAGLLAGKLIPTNQVRESDPILLPIPESMHPDNQAQQEHTVNVDFPEDTDTEYVQEVIHEVVVDVEESR